MWRPDVACAASKAPAQRDYVSLGAVPDPFAPIYGLVRHAGATWHARRARVWLSGPPHRQAPCTRPALLVRRRRRRRAGTFSRDYNAGTAQLQRAAPLQPVAKQGSQASLAERGRISSWGQRRELDTLAHTAALTDGGREGGTEGKGIWGVRWRGGGGGPKRAAARGRQFGIKVPLQGAGLQHAEGANGAGGGRGAKVLAAIASRGRGWRSQAGGVAWWVLGCAGSRKSGRRQCTRGVAKRQKQAGTRS